MKSIIFLFFCSFSITTQAGWVVHDLGQTYINSIPKRIVALNWTQAEMLLSLGITPIGITNIRGYRYWQSNHPPLPEEGVTELGYRGTPSLQAIAALKPDLILGYSFRHAKLYTQLQTIAPTLIFDQYPSLSDPKNYFDRMQSIFITLADCVDKTAQAQTVLIEMRQKIAQARNKIIASGHQGESAVFGKFVGMGMGMRVYGAQSLAGSVITQLGLNNTWTTSLPGRDFNHLQLTQLAELDDAHLIFVGELHKEGKKIVSSPIWPKLPFVKQKKLYQSPQLWGFGGPISAWRMAESFAMLLTNSADKMIISTGE